MDLQASLRADVAGEYSLHTWLPERHPPGLLDVGEGTVVPGSKDPLVQKQVSELNATRPGRWLYEHRGPRKTGIWVVCRVDPTVFAPHPHPGARNEHNPFRHLEPGDELQVQFLTDFETDFEYGTVEIHGAVFRAPVRDAEKPLWRLECLSNPFA